MTSPKLSRCSHLSILTLSSPLKATVPTRCENRSQPNRSLSSSLLAAFVGQPQDYDRLRYRKRNIVERFINRTEWYRRIFTRYEKPDRRFMACLHFAATLVWLEGNVNEPWRPLLETGNARSHRS